MSRPANPAAPGPRAPASARPRHVAPATVPPRDATRAPRREPYRPAAARAAARSPPACGAYQSTWLRAKASASFSEAPFGIVSATRPSARETRNEKRRARAERRSTSSSSGNSGIWDRPDTRDSLATGTQIADNRTKGFDTQRMVWQLAATLRLPAQENSMPKEEWGVKRLCPHCANRFYDLNNDPMTCPVCGNSFTLESLTSARGRTLSTSKATPSKADEPVIEEDDDLDTDTSDVELDDDLLEDDDDDDNVSLDEIADVSTEDKDDS